MTETVSIEVGKDEANAMLSSLLYQKRVLADKRIRAIANNDEELTASHTARLEAVKTAIATLEAVAEEAPMD